MLDVIASFKRFGSIDFLEVPMRTTLNIDDDILMAAKEIAKQQGISTGRALSDLAR